MSIRWWPGRLIGLLALVALSVACTDSPGRSGTESSTSAEVTPEALADQAEASVRDYVSSLAAGRYDDAWRLLCDDARVGGSPAALGEAASALSEALGGLAIDTLAAREVGPTKTTLVLRLKGSSTASLVETIVKSGRLVPCQGVIDGSIALGRLLDTTEVDVPTATTLAEFAKLHQPDGFEALPPPNAIGGALSNDPDNRGAQAQLWRHVNTGVTVRITALDYASPEAAHRVERRVEESFELSRTEAFKGPGPVARGFRILSLRGTLIQPPGVGPTTDFLAIRYGSRLYLLYAQPLVDSVDHSIILAAADSVVAQASR